MKQNGGGWFNPILTTIASGVHKLVRAHQQHHARKRRGGRKKTIKTKKVAFAAVRPVEVLH